MQNIIPNLSLIVAVAQNWAIGKDNQLLWHISDDLKRCKALTTGHPVIMGRKTFESLPQKPLPNRQNIVITSSPDFEYEGVVVVNSIDQLIETIPTDQETFLIGGALLYSQLLPYVAKMYVTKVYKDFDADAFFPEIKEQEFRAINISPRQTDEKSGLQYEYIDYVRV